MLGLLALEEQIVHLCQLRLISIAVTDDRCCTSSAESCLFEGLINLLRPGSCMLFSARLQFSGELRLSRLPYTLGGRDGTSSVHARDSKGLLCLLPGSRLLQRSALDGRLLVTTFSPGTARK